MRPRTTYLIDTENVKNSWSTILDETRRTDDFIIFYTANSANVPVDLVAKIVNGRRKAEFIKTDTGTNALDVTLMTELGRRVERDAAKPSAQPHAYIIVSDDKGYDPAIQHLARCGVQASRTATHCTDAHSGRAKQPAETETGADTSTPDKPRYVGTPEKWRQTLLAHEGVTESDVTVCVRYLQSAMQRLTCADRLGAFKTALVKYYKNAALSDAMWARVGPAIQQIAKEGPFTGAAKKRLGA